MSCHRHSCHHFGCGCSCIHEHSYCPFPQWLHPILCNPTHLCQAENENGPTLVIHSILLEPCGNQSCTPRTLTIRITGPSYPSGETFTLRAGSCTEIDEPLVITGLIPGQYQIEQITACTSGCGCGCGCSCGCGCGCGEYDTTFTGPICDGSIAIVNSLVPVVITIVNRKRLRGCRRRYWCGCGYGVRSC